MTIAARPTVYRGIQMRSRLEARFAAYLDLLGAVWSYEPRAYGGRGGQYLPDFQVGDMFIEVKPTRDRAVAVADSGRMEVIWESEPEAQLVIVTDGGPAFVRRSGIEWQERVSEWTVGGYLAVIPIDAEMGDPVHIECYVERDRLLETIADRDDEIRDKNMIIATLREAAGRI